ncbi:BgTH12-04869 [Blumeria graminis f. sp. triticale]|uniref:BgtAc-30393 n=3 Tax=Blumeria graminis TaxID=34373 RepID=A0A9X9L8R0_BLUGR|nr:hypothetical protein BGT96224_Ac30393 [Blumeria graminis f. sp. tritici 96224]CAD6499217.1 BgTH12-04869 [Blumeria graminis f. sp. triticale]VCU39335.1 BgtAc-30393 [Blumeria graminis f. sp. tritici]
MTESNVKDHGTYTKLYCSFEYTDSELMRILYNEKINSPPPYNEKFDPESSLEKSCHQSLSTNRKRIMGSNTPRMSEILGKNGCTVSVLASLSLKKKIETIDENWVNPDTTVDIIPKMIVDREIKLEDVVLGGNFFNEAKTIHRRYALAWCEGYLRLFERERLSTVWVSTTTGLSNMLNGAPMNQFLFFHNPQIKAAQSKLEKYNARPLLAKASRKIHKLKHPLNKDAAHRDYSNLNGVVLDRLPLSSATGLIHLWPAPEDVQINWAEFKVE